MILNSKILLSLTKSRLAISVVFSALAGYILAADDFDFLNVFLLLVGGYCIVVLQIHSIKSSKKIKTQ